MAYKKYHYRGGKRFGPYYYKSYRDSDGKVQKEYVGTLDPDNRGKIILPTFFYAKYFILIILLAFIVSFVFLGGFYYAKHRITGLVVSENISQTELNNILSRNEAVVNEYNSRGVSLEIKDSPNLINTRNQNLRMDFNFSNTSVRLYFDLMNYSEFVENVAEEVGATVMVNRSSLVSSAGSEETAVDLINETASNETPETITSNDETINNETFGLNESETESITWSESTLNETETFGEDNETIQEVSSITGNVIRAFAGTFRVVQGLFSFNGMPISGNSVAGDNVTLDANSSLQNSVNSSVINFNESVQDSSNKVKKVNIKKVKNKIPDLNKKNLEVISDNSTIDAENFKVVVDKKKSALRKGSSDYKWGYKVKLNDLKFMAKIEVTSDKGIELYSNDSLKIGNAVLSFKDLEDAGYNVSFEIPSLSISVDNLTIENFTLETIENITVENVTEVNITEMNVTEINLTEVNITVSNITVINETLGNVSSDNDSENDSLSNITEVTDNGNDIGNVSLSEDNESESGEITSNETTENNLEETTEVQDNSEVVNEEAVNEEIVNEEQTSNEPAVEPTPEASPVESSPEPGITGNMIRFFYSFATIIGRVVQDINVNNSVVIEDIEYKNKVIIYLERDFTGTDYKVGDILDLDPEFFILDAVAPVLSFYGSTPSNGYSTTNTSFKAYVQVTDADLETFIWDWRNDGSDDYIMYNDSLVLMMNFDNSPDLSEGPDYGCSIHDASLYANHGTSYNTGSADPCGLSMYGKYGGSIELTGSDDYIGIPNMDNGNGITNVLSAFAWIQRGANIGSSSNDRIIMPIAIYGWELYFENDYLVFGQLSGSPVYSTGRITDSNWHHVGVVYDGDVVCLYIDGIRDGTSCEPYSTSFASSGTYTIGTGNGGAGEFFSGYIDEVRVWKRALTPFEVYLQYASNFAHGSLSDWYFYINQSQNITDGLSPGTYYYRGVAESSNLVGETGVRSIIILNAAPSLTIINPLNNSNYNSLSVEFNVSSNQNLSWCGLSIDNGANATMTLNSSLTGADYINSSMTPGYHNFTISCNDTSGTFRVIYGSNILIDTAFPQINFTGQTPANGTTQNANSAFVNVSSSDNGQHSVVMDWNNSLVGWWRFNNEAGENSTFVKDSSSYGNNGTCSGTGCPNFTTAGKLGGAYSFDGVNDYVNLSGSNFPLENSPRTISIWIKTAQTGEKYFFSYGTYSSARTFELGIYNNRFTVGSYGGAKYANTIVNDNSWHHVVGIWNGSEVIEYVDGMQQSLTMVGSFPSVLNTTSYRANIGKYVTDNYYFNGLIDDVQIYNLALSTQEVLAIYNATASQYYNNFTSLSVGDHTFIAYAQDLGGNVNNTETRSFSVDTSIPSITVSSPLNASNYNNASVLFNVSSSETGSGMIVPNLDSSLVSWWRMDDLNVSGGVVDYMGRNNGTNVNATQVDSGKFGKAMSFNGSGSYYYFSPSLNMGTNNSLSVWIKSTSLNPYAIAGNNTNFNYMLRIDSTKLYYNDGSSFCSIDYTRSRANVWQYWASVRINNNISFYLNGTLLGGCLLTTNNNTIINTIGRANTLYFNGSMDEVTIFNKSLSPSEVLQLYNATASAFNNTLAEGSHTYSAYVSDNAGNVNNTETRSFSVDTSIPSITVSSPLNASNYNSASVLFNVSSSETGTGFIVPNLDSSLVGWWRMDDLNSSGGVVDYMGRNNGTNTSITQVSNGKFGKAMSFDGINSRVTIPNNDLLNLGTTQNFTISLWVYPTTYAANSVALGKGNVIGASNSWGFNEAAGSTIQFRIRDGSNIIITSGTLNYNQWNHLVGVRASGAGGKDNLTFYINGVLVNSGSSNTLINVTTTTAISFANSHTTLYNGSMDEVMIFNRSLSANEILQLYNATASAFNNTLADGSHTYNAYVSDTAGNVNTSLVNNFSVDTTVPTVNITYPTNTTLTNYASAINYTSDSSGYCWYGNGSINSSAVSAGINWTNVNISIKGSNTFTVWCNDSSGNIGSSSVSFSVDNVIPTITLVSPVNSSNYNLQSVLFNVSSSETGTGFIVPNLDSSLVSWWRMDDISGTTVIDYAGLNNGTITGNAKQVDNGKFGKAMVFNVSAIENIGLPSNSYFTLTQNNPQKTVSAWFNTFNKSSVNIIYLENDWNYNTSTSITLYQSWLRCAIGRNFVQGASYSLDNINNDQWYHVVCIANSSGNFMYLNGNLTASALVVLQNYSLTGTHNIGRISSATFNGMIDEVAVWNRSLSPLEVLQLYNATAMQFNNTLADGSHTYNAYVSDTAGNVNTSLVNNFSVDTSIPTITVSSPTNGSNYNSASVLFNVSSSETGTGMIIPNLDNSLVSWWRMDDINSSGGVVDYTGRNNGTNIGATQVDNGKFGKGFSFDGVSSYVNTNLIFNSSSFAVSAWINPGATYSGFRDIITQGNYWNANKYSWAVTLSGTSLLMYAENGTGYGGGTTATTITANQYQHIFYNYEASSCNLTFYKNSILVKSYIKCGQFANPNCLGGSCKIIIGNRNSGDEGFNGSIDEVMIFNRSLTSSEVLALYNATAMQFNNTLADGSHTYNAYVSDIAGNVNTSLVNSFSVQSDSTAPQVTYSSDSLNDSTRIWSDSIYVNVSVVEDNLKNITFKLYYSNNTLVNSTNYSTAVYNINWTNLAGEDYKYNVSVCDLSSNCNATSTRSVTLITSESNITLFSGWNLVSLEMKNQDTGTDRNITIYNGGDESIGGWNLIGYSSNRSIALENSTFTNESGTTLSWDDAVAAGKLQGYISYYDSNESLPSARKYKYVSSSELGMSDTNLTNKIGYWVYSYENGNLTLPNVGGSATGQTYQWSKLRFSNGTSELNITQAGGDGEGWIINSLIYWGYDDGSERWSFIYINGDTPKDYISSWEGVWVWSNRDNITMIRDN